METRPTPLGGQGYSIGKAIGRFDGVKHDPPEQIASMRRSVPCRDHQSRVQFYD